MDLKKQIEELTGTVYAFSKLTNNSPARVYYWCNTPWERLTWTTKNKIEKYLDEVRELSAYVD